MEQSNEVQHSFAGLQLKKMFIGKYGIKEVCDADTKKKHREPQSPKPKGRKCTNISKLV